MTKYNVMLRRTNKQCGEAAAGSGTEAVALFVITSSPSPHSTKPARDIHDRGGEGSFVCIISFPAASFPNNRVSLPDFFSSN